MVQCSILQREIPLGAALSSRWVDVAGLERLALLVAAFCLVLQVGPKDI